VFKSLILPNITFIGSCTIIPKEYIQTFKNILYEFLWKGKNDPVKRSVLSNDYLEGGIIVQEPINVMLGSISDLNTAILPINEMFLWFQFFIMALHLLSCFS
jgi:hypothetical protein